MLNYLECVCHDVGVADIIAFSQVPALLVRLVKTDQPPALRIRSASMLGTLIRFARILNEALPATGDRPPPHLTMLGIREDQFEG